MTIPPLHFMGEASSSSSGRLNADDNDEDEGFEGVITKHYYMTTVIQEISELTELAYQRFADPN